MNLQPKPHEYTYPDVHEIVVPKATLEHDVFIEELIAPYVQLSFLYPSPDLGGKLQ